MNTDKSGLLKASGLDVLDFMDLLNKCHKSDWVKFAEQIPDKSIQLIIMDMPYFEVKGEFDFIWATFEDYLQDVELWAKTARRILADNGSLYAFGHAKNIAYVQVIFDKYFSLEGNVVWEVYDRQTKKNEPEQQRTFIPITERILFYSNDYEPGEYQKTGLDRVLNDVNHFKELREHFRQWQEATGLTKKAIIEQIGQRADHAFRWGSSQWSLPTIETYNDLLKIPLENGWKPKEYEELRKEYEELRKEYEELRKEYEELRRPFNGKPGLFDVLKFSQEAHITKQWPHDTPKPPKLIRTLIEAASRRGDIVFSPFSGSGVDAEQATLTGRQWVACDTDQYYVDMTNRRAAQAKGYSAPRTEEEIRVAKEYTIFDML